MPSNNVMSEKKKALIAYKEKILEELKYYDKRIEDVQSSSCSKTNVFQDADSSDSDTDFSVSIDCGPSIAQLKLQQSMVKTCLQATQELTNVQILQSEVNVLVESPIIEGEPLVSEQGIWREVTAECRVDLVPFSVNFFVHQPERRFAPLSYRGLRVSVVKAAHEAELSKSVLPTVGKPSNAVEVLRSYAAAHRSRRTTLARLAEKYANNLFMEPRLTGGYVLRCAGLLEVSWSLQNKWSPIAPFHHRLKFDLEYMDESYIKIITQAHRQLSDPSIETDERTLQLSKIIATCLEAQGPTQELYESMSSDPETAQTLRKRRTTLDQEIEAPSMQKKKDSEVMAPPKSLPKKAKPKGKENNVDNKKVKRSISDENVSNVKKIKTNNIFEVNSKKTDIVVDKANSDANNKNNKEVIEELVEKPKNVTSKSNQNNDEVNKKNVERPKSVTSNNKETKTTKSQDTKIDNAKNTNVASVKNTAGPEQSAGNKKKCTNDDNNVNKISKNDANAKNSADKVELNKNSEKTKSKEKNIKDKGDKVTGTKIPNKVHSNKNSENVVKQKSDLEKTGKDVVPKDKENNTGKDKSSKDKQPNQKTKKVIKKPSDEIVKKNTYTDDTAKNLNKVDSNKNSEQFVKQKSNLENTGKDVILINKEDNSGKDKSSKDKQPIQKTKKIIKIPSDKIISKITNTGNTAEKIKTKEPGNLDKPSKFKEVASIKSKESANIESNKKQSNTIPAENIKPKSVTSSKPVIDKNKIINKQKVVSSKIKKITTVKDKTIEKVIEKSRSSLKRKSNLAERTDQDTDNNVASAKKLKTSKPEKVSQNAGDRFKKNNENLKKQNNFLKKSDPKLMKPRITGSIKTHTSGNIEKFLNSGNTRSAEKGSKIPQKLSFNSDSLKKNPLRISPRKIPSKFKTTSDTNLIKTLQKTTNIPRLLKKPTPKI